MELDKFIAIQQTALQRYYNQIEPAGPEDVHKMDVIMADLDNQTPYRNPHIQDAMKNYLDYLDFKVNHASSEANPMEANNYKLAYKMTQQAIKLFNRPLGEDIAMTAFAFVDYIFSDYHEVWDIVDIAKDGYHLSMRQNPRTGFDLYPNGDMKIYTLQDTKVDHKLLVQFLSQAPKTWFEGNISQIN